MKYCVTLNLREFDNTSTPIFTTLYFESVSVKDLNDFLFKNVCNSTSHSEVFGLFFEVVKE